MALHVILPAILFRHSYITHKYLTEKGQSHTIHETLAIGFVNEIYLLFGIMLANYKGFAHNYWTKGLEFNPLSFDHPANVTLTSHSFVIMSHFYKHFPFPKARHILLMA